MDQIETVSYNLKTVIEARSTLLTSIFANFLESQLTSSVLVSLTQQVYEKILFKAPYSAVFGSFRHLAGSTFTSAVANEMAWLIAGNLKKIVSGVPVTPWTGQSCAEWVPVQVSKIIRTTRSWKARNELDVARAVNNVVYKSGVAVSLLILAGSPAGKTIRTFWSDDACQAIKVHFGFDKYNKSRFSRVVSKRDTYPFQNPVEFYKMRCLVLLDPLKSKATQPKYSEMKKNATMIAWNRQLMQYRLRETFDCPAGWSVDEMECVDCPKGQDFCKAACHKETFIEGTCSKCQKVAVLDPESCGVFGNDPLCLNCREG